MRFTNKLLPAMFAAAAFITSCQIRNIETDVVTGDTREYLTIEDAKAEVEDILNDIYLHQTKASESEIVRTVSSCKSVKGPDSKGQGENDIYIINFSDSLGFALMSSKRDIGLLCLTLKGHLESLEDCNETLGTVLPYLENYSAAGGGIPGGGLGPDDDLVCVFGDWENIYYEPTYGYCQVKWGQGDPYNSYCPSEDGIKCPTGCVAVAVAQLMSIYRYPASYGGHTYTWWKMILNPRNRDDNNTIIAANLMADLGESDNLAVSYHSNLSSASPLNIPSTFENFGYTSGGSNLTYNSGSLAQELQNGYPALVYGSAIRTATASGYTYNDNHIWLVHGLLVRRQLVSYYVNGVLRNSDYLTYNYLLCNFGWDEDCDGFYAAGAFDTNAGPSFDDIDTRSQGQQGYYRYNMGMITGIRR